MESILKIVTFIPEEYAERLMDDVNEVTSGMYPNYDRAFSITSVTGTWRPLEGSRPFKGTVGKIEVAQELRIEFVIRKEDLNAVVKTIRKIHPYEEPGIDIIEMIDWHSL